MSSLLQKKKLLQPYKVTWWRLSHAVLIHIHTTSVCLQVPRVEVRFTFGVNCNATVCSWGVCLQEENVLLGISSFVCIFFEHYFCLRNGCFYCRTSLKTSFSSHLSPLFNGWTLIDIYRCKNETYKRNHIVIGAFYASMKLIPQEANPHHMKSQLEPVVFPAKHGKAGPSLRGP